MDFSSRFREEILPSDVNLPQQVFLRLSEPALYKQAAILPL